LNLLFVCEGLTRFSIIAQPWKHVNEIAMRLAQRGNSVSILSDRYSTLPLCEEIKGIPVIRIKKRRLLFDLNELSKALDDDEIDIINWHATGPLSLNYVWRLKNRLKKGVVLSLHGGFVSFRDISNLRIKEVLSLYKFWNNILYSMCPSFVIKRMMQLHQIRTIITLSESLKSCLEKIGIEESKMTVIPSGVDLNEFQPTKREDLYNHKKELGFDEDPIILYFGHFSSFRGIDTLISAMPLIRTGIPKAKLLLLARRSAKFPEDALTENSWLKRNSSKEKSIKLLSGVQTRETLIKYLALSDVVVLPFKFWPQVECPLTILEAMAMGKPVISTCIGTVPEIIHHGVNGVLVRPGDINAISKAVIAILNGKDLSMRIGKAAREHIERFYDWNIITQRTEGVFRNIL